MLNPKLHKAYDDAVRNFSAMKFEVEVQAQGIAPQDLVSVYNAVLEDCPELFYITHRPKVGQKMGFFGSTFRIVSSSIFSPSQVGNYKIELDKIAKDFKNKTANLKTVEEKFP